MSASLPAATPHRAFSLGRIGALASNTILAKPVPRLEYLLGKLLGVMVLIFIAILVMSAVSAGVLRFWEGVVIAQQTASTAPEDLDHVIATVRAAAFNPNLIPGVLVI